MAKPASRGSQWHATQLANPTVPGQMLGPELHIRMPGRAGAVEARFYREDGSLWRPFTTVFGCGSPPVPVGAASWGRVKSVDR